MSEIYDHLVLHEGQVKILSWSTNESNGCVLISVWLLVHVFGRVLAKESTFEDNVFIDGPFLISSSVFIRVLPEVCGCYLH